MEALTGRRCGITGRRGCLHPALSPALRRQTGLAGGLTSKGTPCFTLPAGGTLTFEPGGQLEYSSPPCRSASILLALLRSVVLPLRAAAADEGIDLLAVGIDPLNPAERAPMLIHATATSEWPNISAAVGPAGARMMRQTAAFQVSARLR